MRNNKASTENKETKHKGAKKLPGEYPPSEDIMNPVNEAERVHVDLDDLSLSRATSAEIVEDAPARPLDDKSNLTKEDKEALGPKDLSLDLGDDEQLKHRRWPVDFAARDLDIPGSELDDRDEAIGSEDEENNSYSVGGDRQENLEEDPMR
ncbi:MAG TPA: hypothetical protein VIN08_00315 [Ohtaekwangia sp.]|uniref:hypothetical protein n=1 Tax=Ohtaekwangia sp. TaxID=2066019 RepID=UPI002F940FC3